MISEIESPGSVASVATANCSFPSRTTSVSLGTLVSTVILSAEDGSATRTSAANPPTGATPPGSSTVAGIGSPSTTEGGVSAAAFTRSTTVRTRADPSGSTITEWVVVRRVNTAAWFSTREFHVTDTGFSPTS